MNIKKHINATIQESIITSDAEEAKGSDNINCDQCDSELRNSRGLKAHQGRFQKNISQLLDGFIEEVELDENCEFTFESDYADIE